MSSSGPDLFVVCKNCGSEVSPYITECPYCGSRLRKRAPKLDREGRPTEKPRRRITGSLPPLRRGRDPGHPRRRAAVGDRALLVVASLVPLLLLRASVVRRGRLVIDGTLGRRVVAGADRELRLRQPRLRLRRAGGGRASSAGCSSAATARCPVLLLFLSGGALGMLAVAALESDPHGVGRQRRRDGPAVRRGPSARCSPCAAATTSTPTCSACWSSRSPCSRCRSRSPRPARSPRWPARSSGCLAGLPLSRLGRSY